MNQNKVPSYWLKKCRVGVRIIQKKKGLGKNSEGVWSKGSDDEKRELNSGNIIAQSLETHLRSSTSGRSNRGEMYDDSLFCAHEKFHTTPSCETMTGYPSSSIFNSNCDGQTNIHHDQECNE